MILVFDTETTGLPLHPNAPLEKQPKIIEWGGALLDRHTLEIIEEFNVMIDPGEPITEEITKITGITNADLATARRFKEVAPEIFAMIEKADRIVAHNLPFDKSLMSFDIRRNFGEEFYRKFMKETWPKIETCTVSEFRPVWGRNPRLVELYEWSLGKPLEQTHRALDDVKRLVEVIQEEKLFI